MPDRNMQFVVGLFVLHMLNSSNLQNMAARQVEEAFNHGPVKSIL